MLLWFWIALGTLSLLALYQQFRIYRIHREAKRKEELFQIFTENAADMIALGDVSGRRLYNSPAYERTERSEGSVPSHRDYLTPFPGETTLPYSLARLRRSNMRQASSEILLMASSPSRSLRRNAVITQIT
jgi:hypothetical protein